MLKGEKMAQIKDSKKLGIGSVSLILSILGGMFSFTAWNGKYLGEHILSAINISSTFQGTLLVTLISLVILFISYFIGYSYKDHYFAKSGRVIAIIFISLIFFLILIKIFLYL